MQKVGNINIFAVKKCLYTLSWCWLSDE